MYKFCFIVLALTMASFVKAQFKVSKQVFSNAATQQSSPNILLNGSVGQAIIFTTNGNGITNQQGFWPAYQKLFISQNDELLNYGICIYPNPVSENLTIETKEAGLNKVQLYDIYGNLVIDIPVPSFESKISVNIKHLPASTYYLYLSNSMSRLKTMIVKF